MSKKFLNAALKSIDQFIKQSNINSHQTKHAYRMELRKAIQDLHQMGSNISNINDIKPKHVTKLVEEWKKTLSVGTIKNRLSKIRTVFRSTARKHLLSDKNDIFNIGSRLHAAKVNKAITDKNLSVIADKRTRDQIKLSLLFGLRREESLKFKPHLADHGHYIVLEPTWTKGGVGRAVPILNKEQRDFIDQLKKEIPEKQSMIENDKNYKAQLNIYNNELKKAGIKNPHGYRHAYAQERYRELTNYYTQGSGWESPINDGKTKEQMSETELKIDFKARRIISNELGHSRVSIVRSYLA